MTEFLLIRHAVNDYVKTNRLAGWTPGVHLNDEGIAQAAALGERLANTSIDAIYASPLERTVETAQAVIAHHPDLQLQILEDVGEVRYGDWTAGEIKNLVQRKMWQVIQQYPSRAYFPNGEAMRDVQIRAVNGIEQLVKKHPRGKIAVVSHSDVIKMIVAHYLGMHLDLFQRIEISPASLTVLVMGASRPTLVQLNETSYLPKPQKGDQKSESVNSKETIVVQSITVDAIGQPGARTFYLQAHRVEESKPEEIISILLEKTQALALADQIDDLFSQLVQTQPELPSVSDVELPPLIPPENVTFRAGNIGLQYEQASDLVKLEIRELRGIDQGTPDMLHLLVSRSQLRALGIHAREVVQSGAVVH